MKLENLRNLGKKSAAMLAQAGIHTPQELQDIGAVEAYLRVIESNAQPSLNLLWALEGALSDRDWRDIAQKESLALLLALEEAQEMRSMAKK